MRITWVTRSFLDYRIPVYAELDRLCGHELTLICNAEVVPTRCLEKVRGVLGDRAVALCGEMRLTGEKMAPVSSVRRGGIRIPLQPGLVKACRASRPEVCVSDGFFQWTYAPLWLRFRDRIPHVMCYEPTKHTERNAQWYRTCYRRWVSRWCDEICCNGTLCAEYCRDVLHIPESKLCFGNMAADSENLAARCAAISAGEVEAFRQQHGLTGRKVFLFVGRLVELKGIRQLLEAWAQTDMREAVLLCAGDGAQRSEYEAFCRERGIRAVFAGNIDYDQLPICYRSADVFIIPTLQDNWSLVVPEAMACGLPVACSIYNGCHPELVHPENGWTFDPLDGNDTLRVLHEILAKTPEELKIMGQASRNIVAGFTPRRAAEEIYRMCNLAVSCCGDASCCDSAGGGNPS